MEEINKEYPVVVNVEYPQESSRLLALLAIPWFFLKILLLLPHLIVLYFLNLASMFVVWLSYWAILFKKKYPRTFFNFTVSVLRWQVRVSAWLFSLTDKYPPFKL